MVLTFAGMLLLTCQKEFADSEGRSGTGRNDRDGFLQEGRPDNSAT